MARGRWRRRQVSTAALAVFAVLAVLVAGLQWLLVASGESAGWNTALAVGWTLAAAWYLGSLVSRMRRGEPIRTQHGDGASWWHL